MRENAYLTFTLRLGIRPWLVRQVKSVKLKVWIHRRCVIHPCERVAADEATFRTDIISDMGLASDREFLNHDRFDRSIHGTCRHATDGLNDIDTLRDASENRMAII